MSVSLSAERDRIQRQVEELEQSLSLTHTELELLRSQTDDESDDGDTDEESAAGLLAQREKIQKEIQNLENVLGPHSPISVSDDDTSSNSSEESELGLDLSVDSCLQMNLVYQQVIQETLDQLEILLTHNHRQQREVVSHLSGPIKESSTEQCPPSSCMQSFNMFLGRFLKPYFKDKLTGLGPPANQETKEKASRMVGCMDNKKLRVKRWESWQKTLLIHSVSREGLRRLIQPKLSKVDYLTQKLSSAQQTDRQQLRGQIDMLEREINLLRGKKEDELILDRYEEHDWQKISNIDFEGTRDAEDIRSFWQNFLHPSINKSPWSQEEVQRLKEVSRRHGERHWEAIAMELGTGRTAFLCLQTFQRFVSDSLRHGSWTPAEDALLRELVDKMRIGNFIPYTQMSYFMEGRDPAQLIYRWNQVLDPSLKKGPWTKQEDQLLLRAVCLYGEKDWWKIRMEVPGRHDGSCRDRYYDCLKADTKRTPFEKQEQELLLKLVEKHGVGRWARIAAEIPHRHDAQCLREWRKLSRQKVPGAQKVKKTRKTSANRKAAKKQKTPEKKRKRKNKVAAQEKIRLMNVKEEEEEEIREEEEMVVEYMDSDKEERKMETKEVVEVLRVEEEEEEEYTFPPMQEWIPVKKAQSFTFLSFRPVELPSSGDEGPPVRSTILGQCGRSVIIGPAPRLLPWQKHHSRSTLMMVTPDQLRSHLFCQVDKHSNPKVKTDTHNRLAMMTNRGLEYELRAAVTPWIGNLLIPTKNRLTAADVLREKGEKKELSSTPIFLLLLQTLSVDSVGCKEMIEQRSNKVVLPTSPPVPYSFQKKTPKTIARILQERRVREELQELDLQHKLILKHLQNQQQHEQQKHLLLQQQPQQLVLLQQPPLPHPSSMLSQNPSIILQMPPETFFIPQLMSPPPALHRPPSVVAITSPTPAPHRPTPLSVVPVPLNATSTCSASVPQHTRLSTPKQPSVTSPSKVFPATSPSSSIRNPVRGRRKKVMEHQQDFCSSQNGVDVGRLCPSLNRAGDGVIKEGSRNRKLTLKAKAQQEAAEAKADAKKKTASSPRKKARLQKTKSPREGVVPVPPQQVCIAPVQLLPQTPPAAPQTPPAMDFSSSLTKTELPSAQQTTPLRLDVPATPACCDTTVSSTQNLTLAPPPSRLTNRNMAPSTSSLTATFHNDHDYTLSTLDPTPNQHGYYSRQPSSTPNKPSKAPPRGRKRVRVEEKLNMTSSQDDQCVSGTRDVVAGTNTNVTLEGKRVRKPSQRARALQEAAEAKAEAKKQRTSSSSPRKKRSRVSRFKTEVVPQNQPVTESLPGQSMWVMTPVGMVQLSEAPPQGIHVPLMPNFPFPAPPRNISNHQLVTSPRCLTVGGLRPLAPKPTMVTGQNQPHLLPTVPFSPSKYLPLVSISTQPLPKHLLKCENTVRADPMAPPSLRKEMLQFDPSLMFLESRAEVCDWLIGQGGVVVPGAGMALPYLPPFVSSLSTLSALLLARKSLTKVSLQLLCQGSKPRRPQTTPTPEGHTEPRLPQTTPTPEGHTEPRLPQTTPTPEGNTEPQLPQTTPTPEGHTEPPLPQTTPTPEDHTKETTNQPPDLPDSTSDLRPAEKPAPSIRSHLLQEEAEEAELVTAVRQLVAERFSDNPAYQLLKARFLSCFTLPALLATMQPIAKKTVVSQANEEEEEKEEEEVVEMKKIKERAKQKRAKRSLLLSGAPTNHLSGFVHTNTPTTDQIGPVQTGRN